MTYQLADLFIQKSEELYKEYGEFAPHIWIMSKNTFEMMGGEINE